MAGETINNPVTLSSVLESNRVIAGDRLRLMDGVYSGDFICDFDGTEINPIVIEAINPGGAIIDGDMEIRGSHTHFKNIEFRYSGWTTRYGDEPGGEPSNIAPKQVNSYTSEGIKLINCHLHNLTTFGLWQNATDFEVYGCIIRHIGWHGEDRGHGHGIYTQNNTGTKRFANNIILENFATSIKVYSQNDTPIDNYLIEDNVLMLAGEIYQDTGTIHHYWDFLLGAFDVGNVAENLIIRRNISYNRQPSANNVFGYVGGIASSEISNNYFIAPVSMRLTGESLMTIENNHFIGAIEEFTEAEYPTNTYEDYANIGNVAIVTANEYDSNRAHITVLNQALANTVQVDVSSVLSVGDSYRLRNVQDYFVDIQTGTVAQDGTITVDMQAVNRSVQAPYQWTALDTTFPVFGAFVLEKTS